MKLNIIAFGQKEIQKALKKAEKETLKAWSALLKKIAVTAAKRAKELAPYDSETHDPKYAHYKTTIKGVLLSKYRSRVQSVRGINEGGKSGGHGSLAGLLEYGTVKMKAKPHLKEAVEYALKVHESDVVKFFHGTFSTELKGFV